MDFCQIWPGKMHNCNGSVIASHIRAVPFMDVNLHKLLGSMRLHCIVEYLCRCILHSAELTGNGTSRPLKGLVNLTARMKYSIQYTFDEGFVQYFPTGV